MLFVSSLVALLGGTFVISGWMKLRHPQVAAMALLDFRVTRRPRVRLAQAVAAGELLLGVILLVGVVTSEPLVQLVGAAVATVVLWTFALLISISLARGEHFPCYCFGASEDQLSLVTLGRTVSLALGGSVCVALAARLPADIGWKERILELVLAAAVGGATVIGIRLARVNGAQPAGRHNAGGTRPEVGQ